MKWLQNIFAPLADLFKARMDLKKTQIEAQATAFQTAAQNAADWEKLAAQNAQGSYLDELWTGVLLVPMVLSFAGYDDTVEVGFKSLENVPNWYVWAVLASVGWAFARKDVPKLGSWFRRGG